MPINRKWATVEIQRYDEPEHKLVAKFLHNGDAYAYCMLLRNADDKDISFKSIRTYDKKGNVLYTRQAI